MIYLLHFQILLIFFIDFNKKRLLFTIIQINKII